MRSVSSAAAEARSLALLDRTIEEVRDGLVSLQRDDGHWLFELEADATIPSEYILFEHFLGDVDDALQRKIAAYLRRTQNVDGGWPLYYDGNTDLSATVKAYYALKLAGEDPAAPHMIRARDAVLVRGGAERVNVFTRISLALFGQVPWRAVPVMPVELMLAPRWFPVHLTKVSYWSRVVIAPLLVLMAKKPRAVNPRGIGVRELFITPPEAVTDYIRNADGSRLGDLFVALDHVLRPIDRHIPAAIRDRAVGEAMRFVEERLNGEDGLGGVFPSMVNAVMAFRAMGYPADHPAVVQALAAVRKLLTVKEEEAYCQPCLSPVWDTALAMHALLEAGEPADSPTLRAAAEWLLDRQITDVDGDWRHSRPEAEPGGWAFQYRNDHYPDVDDTAVVGMALLRLAEPAYRPAIDRAADWVLGMQSKNGGWGAFDADNTFYYLNAIPFADHGALLDPPTVDVSARCIGLLAKLGLKRDDPVIDRARAFLLREQERDGSWFGRWGTNYVYGTWSALCALNALGEDPGSPAVRKAVEWLVSRQRADGGWGEDGASYFPGRRGEVHHSTPTQTAWALLGLMAAGEVKSDAVHRGINYLLQAPREGAVWHERHYNAVGFPRIFYITYHGYPSYFPLWALARYRNLLATGERLPRHGL
jgi:squalene-hopene/tetraprenyl-beta-curcumene cyclase